jgi:hypothetical protein
MSVYKEFYFAANEIIKSSRQIWPDSADFGVPVRKGDKMWNLSKSICDQYEPDSRKVDAYSTGSTVTTVFSVYNEYDGSMAEEKWRMEYTTVRNDKNMDGILSIDCLSRKPSKYSNYDY